MSALKPGKRFCDRLDGRRLREYRALDHDHGQRQRTGSFELGGGAGASRVFGDDQFDSMSLEQCRSSVTLNGPRAVISSTRGGSSCGEGASTLRTI